jgi:carboxymethylenebutenolidase
MCFDLDSSPPIPHIHGGSVQHEDLVLTAGDGNEFAAFSAQAGSGVGIVVLPDVRGLFRFYEELALRFAEHGFDAVAIDYFGRTAGIGKRDAEWDFWPEVEAMTLLGLENDVAAAIAHLRIGNPDKPVFVVGFCLGGSNAWHMAAADLDVSGVVGFYGHPNRADFPSGAAPIITRVTEFSCPILALQGGDDPGIPAEVDAEFETALRDAGRADEVIVYEGAPHSFFDRKYAEFTDASQDAWQRILRFIADNS